MTNDESRGRRRIPSKPLTKRDVGGKPAGGSRPRGPGKKPRPPGRDPLPPIAEDDGLFRPGVDPSDFELPDFDDQITGSLRFRRLDSELPLALLPVRLSCRFHRAGGQGTTPTELRVRIAPDGIFGDTHADTLTERERTLGHTYWRRRWEIGEDPAAIDAANEWLAAQLDLGRALWVMRRTLPRNFDELGTAPPKFPRLKVRAAPVPHTAPLLPDRWVAAIYSRNEFMGYAWSPPVTRDAPLVIAPQLIDMPDGSGAREFLKYQELDWRLDFDRALEMGMALKIPVEGETALGLSDLIVFGVNEGDQAAALDELLEHHRYGAGVDIVPQGTPTNNTDDVIAGSTFSIPAAFAAEEIPAEVAAVDLSKRSHDLYATRAADAVATALGLPVGAALARAEHADLRELEHASAMNKVLWPATAAKVLDEILATNESGSLKGVLQPNDMRWLRNHFVRFVRGAALVPALRVGEQPYGVLPAVRMPTFGDQSATPDRRSTLAVVAADVGRAWASSLANVATMSPLEDGDAPGATPADEAVEVAAVLGAVPHPTAFRLRAVTDERQSITGAWATAANELHQMLTNMPRTDAEVAAGFPLYYTSEELTNGVAYVFTEYLTEYDNIYDGSVGLQTRALTRFRDWLTSQRSAYGDDVGNPMLEAAEFIDAELLPLLLAHELRSDPQNMVSGLLDPGFASGASLPTDSDPDLYYSVYADDTGADEAAIVIDDDRAALSAILQERIDALDEKDSNGTIDIDWSVERSLFEAVLDSAVEAVAPTSTSIMRDGLIRLQRALDDGESIDIVRLIRETVGLVTHRHDAWHASVAASRLADLRATRPTGLHVGAYGWLVDVAPDDGSADTHGFIHAPSLDHASTAAVLRSAWIGLTTSAEDRPFAVDLSSDRVRRARWLLSGMRNGQDLGELLGQRFERRLHDAGLDRYIDDVRRLVLDATGSARQPANAIVDGLEIADAFADTDSGALVRAGFEALWATVPNDDRDPFLAAVADTHGDLDSVTDLLMADSVHNLVRGNIDGVAASLAVAGSNPGGLPDPRVADIKRSSMIVTHRVCALLPVSEQVAGPAETANPDVGSWVATMLPPMSTLVVSATLVDEAGTVVTKEAVSLADVGVRPLEFIGLSSSRANVASSRLGQLIHAWFAARWAAPLASITVDLGGIEDAFAVGGALRDAVGAATPMTGADLVVGSGSAPNDLGTIPVRDARRRVSVLVALLGRLRADATSIEAVRRAAGDYAAVDCGATIAVLTSSTGSTAGALKALQASLSRRTAALKVALAPEEPWPDPAEAYRAAVGDAIELSGTVALRFRPPKSAELSFSDGSQRIGETRRARRWMLSCSRVRPGVERLHEAYLTAEAVSGSNHLDVGLAQLADVNGHDDGWAALDLPDSAVGRARTCVFSVTSPTAAFAGGDVAGLVFDAWTEPIPGEDVTTGVSVHFDTPTSRAPQALLLLTTPEDELWDLDVVRTTIKQSLDVARQRAVGPETIDSNGMLLPGVFLDENATITSKNGAI